VVGAFTGLFPYIGAVTVLEVIQRSAGFLAQKGIEESRLHAELLLACVLKLQRMQLYLNFERQLSEGELDCYRALVKRRALREPLQHIVGSAWFCSLEIGVNRHVLIPRPETELLAEQGWQFLCSLAAQNQANGTATMPWALDFGTGSGCVALALAAKCPSAVICAVDISQKALQTASGNAEKLGLKDRVRFFQGDGLAALPSDLRFDLIISNPPYIPGPEIASLQPEVRDFDPREALDGGVDGLDFYRRLAHETPPFLKDHGRLMVEFGDGQDTAIKDLLLRQNWVVEAILEDYTHRPRLMIARMQ
jgi:release factor glutamine methyltransferase